MNRKLTTPTSKKQTDVNTEVLKLGIDIHKTKYVLVAQRDQEAPKPPQTFTPEAFLVWVSKQAQLAQRTYCCYEAGCFGYSLHRKLEAMGITNYVVRPRNWDDYGSNVKTDARDAKELCSHLDRYIAGNKRSLTPVRIPTEEEEQKRSLSRQRDVLSKERKRIQNIGTSNGRYYGIEIPANWWKPKIFESLRTHIPQYLQDILGPYQAILQQIDVQLREATAREERTANRLLPVGLGALTASILDREFVDYSRFSNRREVASYTGLCPGEASSGGKRQQRSINKHGNPRIRHMLIEAVWRMFHFQPDYKAILKWKERIASEPFGPAKKKKMAVAIARQFSIDWWRIQTGQAKPEDLGLRMGYPTSYATKALREGRVSRIYA
ncbi:IS110 family transposase [Puniceicoccaceae bacterium K14]|nr:IS110 family transposase [Puniceicoccaceae bacterium K14]